MKYILTAIALFFITSGFAQISQVREDYIKKFYPLAISEMERSGIPASITLAQGCWESQNGNSRLAVEGNNHFGIKCKKEWTGKKIYHDDDAKHECFRKYAHAEASYIDHSDFLMNSSRYAFLFQLDPKDYVGWARGLKQAGYATDPTYADRLIKIIEDYKLYYYDEYGANRQLASIPHTPEPVKSSAPSITKQPVARVHKIEFRNGLKSYVVGEGETYESITKKLKMKDWQLAEYNDFARGRRLQENEIVYVEPKHKKSDRSRKIYVTEEGDTMHFISQKYGLKLKPLLRRNRMKTGDEPATGENVYLRNKRPRRA